MYLYGYIYIYINTYIYTYIYIHIYIYIYIYANLTRNALVRLPNPFLLIIIRHWLELSRSKI